MGPEMKNDKNHQNCDFLLQRDRFYRNQIEKLSSIMRDQAILLYWNFYVECTQTVMKTTCLKIFLSNRKYFGEIVAKKKYILYACFVSTTPQFINNYLNHSNPFKSLFSPGGHVMSRLIVATNTWIPNLVWSNPSPPRNLTSF